jgi:hypothetical protein
MLPAHCPGVCVQFTDDAYITTQGVKASRVVVISSTPADGSTFTLGGVVWTFKTTPTAGTYEVNRGTSSSTAATNLVAALYGHPLITLSNYTITRVFGNITITALKFGTAYTLAFAAGTAPVTSTTSTAGADPVLLSPWRLTTQLTTRSRADATDYDDSPEVVVAPLVSADPKTGTLSMAAALPLSSFLRPLFRVTFPDRSLTSVLQPGAVVEARLRHALNNGPRQTTSTLLFAAAQCPHLEDPEVLDRVSPFYAITGQPVRWAMHVHEGDRYCQGASPVFSAFVGTSPLTVTVEGGSGAEIADPFNPATPGRVMGLEVNPTEAIIAPSYSGPVTIDMRPASGAGYEPAGYTIDGCDCGHYLTFFNGFGMYESCPLTSAILYESVEVSASPVLAPTACGVYSPAPFVEAANRGSRVLGVRLPPQDMAYLPHRDRLQALLRSPEVWYEFLDIDGEWRRARITPQRGDSSIRATALDSTSPTSSIDLEIRFPDERGNYNA